MDTNDASPPLRPNLFDFATSELSQDAFLCWFIACADPRFADVSPVLRGRALAFLNLILAGAGKAAINGVVSLDVTKQHKNIDVFVELTSDADERYCLIIEDKTHTSESGGQMARYREIISQDPAFSEREIISVYLKTGHLVGYDRVSAPYVSVSRRDLLKIMSPNGEADRCGDIYADFYRRLRQWEDELERFATTPVSSWEKSQWCGFFTRLQEELDNVVGWDYVNNPSGGFWGLYWHFRKCRDGWGEDAELYLQLEERDLCVKAILGDKEAQTRRKWDYHHSVLKAGEAVGGLTLSKRGRLRTGAYTTLAYTPYIVTLPDSDLIDMERTVAFLRHSQKVIDEAVGIILRSATPPHTA